MKKEIAKVAVPVATPGSLLADRARHFGAAIGLVFVDLRDGKVYDTTFAERKMPGSTSCDDLVEHVLQEEADTVIVTQIGTHALRKLKRGGVEVVMSLVRPGGGVSLAIRDLLRGDVRRVRIQDTCEMTRAEAPPSSPCLSPVRREGKMASKNS